MDQRKAPPDSTRTAHTQKPFVRLDDIGDASLIVVIISGVIICGSFIAMIILFDDSDRLPPVALPFIALILALPSVGLGVASYALVRRKYALPWSAIGLTFDNWQRGLLWALAMLPIALFACWLEDQGWQWMLYRRSVPLLSPWQSPLESIALWGKDYGVAEHCTVVIYAIFVVFSQGIFFWGLGYNAVEREHSSVLSGIFNVSFAFLLAYLVGFPFLLPLPFVSACIITFGYQRTRTLLTPLTMTIGVFLFFQYVAQPTWYDANQFTMHGNCICADDGIALDNGIVTYGGNDYKNVTVVKWDTGPQEGRTTTTSSGAYTFQNGLPRGYNIKLIVTSTHYHQHGTEPSPSLKKCTYSHTEYLSDVKDVTETVERNFGLKPNTVEPPPGGPN